MRSELLNMTKEDVTEVFGQIFDHYVPEDLNDDDRNEAVARLAALFGTTSVTLGTRQNAEKRLVGNNITGTVFDTMCYLIEKIETFGLRIDDERIWWHSNRLEAELKGLIPLRDELEAPRIRPGSGRAKPGPRHGACAG